MTSTTREQVADDDDKSTIFFSTDWNSTLCRPVQDLSPNVRLKTSIHRIMQCVKGLTRGEDSKILAHQKSFLISSRGLSTMKAFRPVEKG